MTQIDAISSFTPVSADKVLGVDNPGGTPLSRLSTVLNLLGAVEFGELYTTGGSGTQAPGASYALATCWDTDGYSSAGMTPANASNKITITETGFYKVDITLSFENDTGELTEFRVYWNAVAQTRLTAIIDAEAGDLHVVKISGFVDVTTGATDIDLRVQCPAGTLTYKEGNFSVTRVGNT